MGRAARVAQNVGLARRDDDMAADIVVVGGGLAGFAAAIEAAEAGAQVLLLEKLDAPGGSSAMCGGCLAFAGTDLQRAAGIDDSSERLFQDLRDVGGLENDESLVRAYTDNQLDTYEWMKARGVTFTPVIETSSGQSVPRVHNLDPADMMRALVAHARSTGAVKVITGARATRLLHDTAEDQVRGVRATQDGEEVTHSARAVILASGGFTRDPDLVHRFAPQYDNAVFLGGEGNVGDGLRMAWKLGADVRDMVYIKGTYGMHPVDTTVHHSCLAVYKGAIAVNQAAERFVDESLSYKLLGDACMRQEYGTTYQILDRGILESGDNRVRILDFERRHELGQFVEADTLEELARRIELDPAALARTVAEYNAGVDARHDAKFGRKHLVHTHGELRRIERGPFYAYPSTAAMFGTYCGLRVDDRMRVLDVYGEPIKGLLAAGEVVGGFHGAAYMTGSALGKAAIFGRIAARTALA
jgi:fumarate reductase flavoprotein subunit